MDHEDFDEEIYNHMVQELFKQGGRSEGRDYNVPINKYSLTCEYCGNINFIAGPEGNIYCSQCSLTYKYDNISKDWLYTAIDPETYLKIAQNKTWSEEFQAFLNKEELAEKQKNKKDNKLSPQEIEKKIDAAEKKLKKKKNINKNKKDNKNE